jgi:MFS family permease
VDSLHVVPLAFVMIAGPQILSAFFFATSERWKSTSLAYVLGACISIPIVVGIAYLIGGGGSGHKGPVWIYYVVLALLLYAMVRTFLKRKDTQPPKWMRKLQTASPKSAFLLGVGLLGVFPSDLVTSFAVGGYLAAKKDPYWHFLGFLAVTIVFLATPALTVLVLGKRAERALPKVRDWMTKNAWIVNEIVLTLFVVMVISNIAKH